jgi:tetratricopeptide (TPR) repeat protein
VSNVVTSDFPGGVFWSSLGDYGGDPTGILNYWALSCGAGLSEKLDVVGRADFLRNWLSAYSAERGRILIVIDDARLEWIDSVALLLRSVPDDAALLLTTREEAVSLAAGCNEVLPPIFDAPTSRSLLLSHAGAGAVHIKPADADVLVSLVGGLPLALELLGKRISQLSRKPGFIIEALLDELRRAVLKALIVPGHSGLAAAFQISYQGLSEAEKRVFRWLGAFAADVFSLTDLAGITGRVREAEEHSLDELVSFSLLGWAEVAGSYRVHPLLHEYSTVVLRLSGEEPEASVAHLRYFAARARAASVEDEPGHIWEGLLPELLQAFEHAGSAQPENILALASLLWVESDYLSLRGFYREGARLLEVAVMAARALGRAGDEAIHTGNLGIAYDILGENEKAKACYRKAIGLSILTENAYDRPAYLGNLGMILRQEGDPKALKCFHEALQLSLDVENWAVAIDQCGHLGTEFRRKDPARALGYYQQGLGLAVRIQDENKLGSMLGNIGLLHFDAQRYGKAEAHITAALEISQKHGNRPLEANLLGHLGLMALCRQKFKQAAGYCAQAVRIYSEIGHQARYAQWLGNLGLIYGEMGDVPKAVETVEQALSISNHVKDREAEAVSHLHLVSLYEKIGNEESVQFHRAQADRILTGIPSPVLISGIPVPRDPT